MRWSWRKKPHQPKAQPHYGAGPGGHRGTAVGSSQPGKQDLSAENVAKWQTLTGAEANAFLYEGKRLYVHSTNVGWAEYYSEANQMVIGYLEDGAYLYSNVTIDEANSFLQAMSKGIWVWDNLRVRGSKTLHKKPYRNLSQSLAYFT